MKGRAIIRAGVIVAVERFNADQIHGLILERVRCQAARAVLDANTFLDLRPETLRCNPP